MSGRDWKPGDVAMIRRIGTGEWEHGVRSTDGTWRCQHGNWQPISEIEVRPAVVIDPESDDDVRRLCEAYKSVDNSVGTKPMQAALRAMTQPPRPPEPTGLGAVVEDEDGALWTRVTNRGAADAWQPNNLRSDNYRNEYSAIAVTRVLSEGWSE